MTGLKIKICGLTRPADVSEAVRAGADLVGFVLAKSSRQISYERLGQLAAGVPAQVQTVAVLVDPSEEEAHRALRIVDRIQLHGREEPDFCARFGRRAIKAIRVHDSASLERAQRFRGKVGGLLFDTYLPGRVGGTGEVFDWGLLEESDRFDDCFLAGGLNPGNVAQAAELALRVGLVGLDVSSGLEVSPGLKDAQLVHSFFQFARSAAPEHNLQEV